MSLVKDFIIEVVDSSSDLRQVRLKGQRSLNHITVRWLMKVTLHYYIPGRREYRCRRIRR